MTKLETIFNPMKILILALIPISLIAQRPKAVDVRYTAPDGSLKTVQDLSSSASGKGAALVAYNENRTMADKAADTYSVRDAGAKGDGITDDYANFQSALTNHSWVLVPPGTYKLSNRLKLKTGNVVMCQSATNTILDFTNSTAGTVGFTTTGEGANARVYDIQVHNCTITRSAGIVASSIGLDIWGNTRGWFSGNIITGFETGTVLTIGGPGNLNVIGTYYNTLDNNFISGNTVGVLAEDGANENYITHGKIADNATANIRDLGNRNVFTNLSVEGNSPQSLVRIGGYRGVYDSLRVEAVQSSEIFTMDGLSGAVTLSTAATGIARICFPGSCATTGAAQTWCVTNVSYAPYACKGGEQWQYAHGSTSMTQTTPTAGDAVITYYTQDAFVFEPTDVGSHTLNGNYYTSVNPWFYEYSPRKPSLFWEFNATWDYSTVENAREVVFSGINGLSSGVTIKSDNDSFGSATAFTRYWTQASRGSGQYHCDTGTLRCSFSGKPYGSYNNSWVFGYSATTPSSDPANVANWKVQFDPTLGPFITPHSIRIGPVAAQISAITLESPIDSSNTPIVDISLRGPVGRSRMLTWCDTTGGDTNCWGAGRPYDGTNKWQIGYGANPALKANAIISIDKSTLASTFTGTVAASSGTNILYRCTVAGTLRVGQTTTVSADCGTAVDTGLRIP